MIENIIIITESVPLIDSFRLHLSKYKPKYSIAQNLSDGSNFLDTKDQLGVFIDIDGITGDYSEILNKNKFTVALGRNNSEDYKQSYLNKGFSLYIQKPINKQVLESIFEDYANFYSSVKTRNINSVDIKNDFVDNIVVEDIIIDDDDFSSEISFKKDVEKKHAKNNSQYDDFIIDIEEEIVLKKDVIKTVVPELIYNKKREAEKIDIDIDISEDDLSEDINGSTLNKQIEYIQPQEVAREPEKPLPNIRLDTKNNKQRSIKDDLSIKKEPKISIDTTKASVNKEQLMLEKMREQLFKKPSNTVVEKKEEIETKEETKQTAETMEERIAKIKSLINERNKRKDRDIGKEELEDKIGVGYKEEDEFIIMNKEAPNYKHKQSFVRYRRDKALFEYRLKKLKEKRMSNEEITKKIQEIEHEEIKIREKTISAREQRRREMYDKLGFSNDDIFSRKTEKIEIKAPTNINRKNESISTKSNKTNSSISPIQIKKSDFPQEIKELVEVNNKPEISDLKSIESDVEIINDIEKENYEKKSIPKISTEDIKKLLKEKQEVVEIKEPEIEEVEDIEIQDDINVIDNNNTNKVKNETKIDILETLRQKKSTVDKQEIIYNDIPDDKTQKSNILKSHADNKDSKRVSSIKDMEERLPKIDLLSLYKPSKSKNNEEKVSSVKKEIEIKPPRHIIEAEEERLKEEEIRNNKKKKGLFGLFSSMKK